MKSSEGPNGRRFRKKAPSRAVDGYRITYSPIADSTPEAEVEVLAAVYRFLLDRRERSEVSAADGAEERGEHGR